MLPILKNTCNCKLNYTSKDKTKNHTNAFETTTKTIHYCLFYQHI